MPIPILIPLAFAGLSAIRQVSNYQTTTAAAKKTIADQAQALKKAENEAKADELQTYAAQLSLEKQKRELDTAAAEQQAQLIPIAVALAVFLIGFVLLNPKK